MKWIGQPWLSMRRSGEIDCIRTGKWPPHVIAQWWGHSVKIQTESYLLATEQDFDATIDNTAIDDSDFDHDDDFDLPTDD